MERVGHRVTLADVAARAGVSRSTASQALNGRSVQARIAAPTEQRIRQAAELLGYRPNMSARELRTSDRTTIGLISDRVASTRFSGGLIGGALEAAREAHHVLLIADTGDDPDTVTQVLNTMLDRQVDGIIFARVSTQMVDRPPVAAHHRIVILNSVCSDPDISCVIPDDELAARTVTQELLDAGHREGIVLIGRNEAYEDPRLSAAMRPRLNGIHSTLLAAGTRLAAAGYTADWDPSFGYSAMTDLLDAGEAPRAVICMNDRLAFGACQALQANGFSIPADVSVISFDDDPIAGWMNPTLTTAALPNEELGRQAVRLLLEGSGPTTTVRVPMPLQRRNSVGPPR